MPFVNVVKTLNAKAVFITALLEPHKRLHAKTVLQASRQKTCSTAN